MKEWLLLLGHSAQDIDELNVIHVAGTKGKGSTCAYVDSILREHARRNGISRKIGLYTSPSLWPRNRIRINSNPLPEDEFFQRFREVCTGLCIDPDRPSPEIKTPGLLQMMAIVSFHTFIKEEVDVVICETHHGGQFDATNFVEHPVITAITKIGMDHVDNLGGSIQNIAWHKSGIFKAGVLALSVPQVPEAEDEMRSRETELGASLHFIKDVKGALLQFITDEKIESIQPEQRENCALATQITHNFLKIRGQSLDEQDVQAGIEKFRWPGRFDIVESGGSTWYLDGAHNEMSMEVVGKWYERVTHANSSIRVLIFAHFSPERTRDWSKILRMLGKHLQTPVQHVIFVKQIEYDHFCTSEERLEEYSQLWERNWPSSVIYKADSVGDSIHQAKNIGLGAQILVTGSLYLVEAALELVKSETRCQVCA
ncbi:hypothetical protein N7494_005942 [Penicillium frequentans]|uniref:tetrahydrofolate synthase n=1 Tax=Penicillium frequentans TaxID=3151616 RepID=A0AAD6CWS5_9EURO|nr:hypothetical protein N7494_005942 [Penicillium glabrum]